MHDWRSFLWSADEWIIAYSALPPTLVSVQLFAIGHACELYLKAANAKITGDVPRAVKFGHNLKVLWDDCKQREPSFMPKHVLMESAYQTSLPELTSGMVERLSIEERGNYFRHHDLFIVFHMLPDLKYLGAPLKSVKGPYSLGFIFPSNYWIEFFREMRAFLGHPLPNGSDAIRHCLDGNELPERSRYFLSQLYAS